MYDLGSVESIDLCSQRQKIEAEENEMAFIVAHTAANEDEQDGDNRENVIQAVCLCVCLPGTQH
eukprot:1401937-Rhodomonas_salina.1